MNLLERALPRERRVNDVEGTGVLARAGGIALKGIALVANDAPDVALERNTPVRVERIEEVGVTRPPLDHGGAQT